MTDGRQFLEGAGLEFVESPGRQRNRIPPGCHRKRIVADKYKFGFQPIYVNGNAGKRFLAATVSLESDLFGGVTRDWTISINRWTGEVTWAEEAGATGSDEDVETILGGTGAAGYAETYRKYHETFWNTNSYSAGFDTWTSDETSGLHVFDDGSEHTEVSVELSDEYTSELVADDLETLIADASFGEITLDQLLHVHWNETTDYVSKMGAQGVGGWIEGFGGFFYARSLTVPLFPESWPEPEIQHDISSLAAIECGTMQFGSSRALSAETGTVRTVLYALGSNSNRVERFYSNPAAAACVQLLLADGGSGDPQDAYTMDMTDVDGYGHYNEVPCPAPDPGQQLFTRYYPGYDVSGLTCVAP